MPLPDTFDRYFNATCSSLKVDFFGPDYGNIAKLEKTDSGYRITMVVDEQIWSNEELMKTLTGLKWIMEDKWSMPTALRLESVSLSGTSRYKDL